MAMITQMAPPAELGVDRGSRNRTGLPGLERNDTGGAAFSDMLRDASRQARRAKPDEVRGAEERQPESRTQDDEPSTDDTALAPRDAARARKADGEDKVDETPASDNDGVEEEATDAAVTAQAAQPLTPLLQTQTEGEADDEAEMSPTFLQVRAETGADRVQEARTPLAPATPASNVAQVMQNPLAGAMDTPMEGGALDLLSPAEFAEMDIQVETEGGDMIDRLQQALAASRTEDLDELGKPVVPQVVRSMAALARNGVSEMRLQLAPGDLGEIEMRVRATEGIVRSELMVQHVEVKQLLESQIERLREALEAQGLRLEGMEVGVSEDGAFARDREGDGQDTPFGRLGDGEGGTEESTEPVSAVPLRPIQLSDDNVDWLV